MKTNDNDSLKAYLLFDVLKDIEGINAKKMFGGYGLYKEGEYGEEDL